MAVEVVAGSVTTDIEQRDKHLKSGDFFELEEYPTITFHSTAVRLTGGTASRSMATSRSRTSRSPSRSRVSTSGGGRAWTASRCSRPPPRRRSKREDWDINWNMAVETGGFLVSKKIDIEIEVEAHKVG